jgi:uncharacterized membrane protein YccC
MTLVTRLQEATKLGLSLALFYALALWVDWDMPKYGALAIALISLDSTGASLRKGVMRLVGTAAGIAVGTLGISLFAQDRWLMLLFLSSYLIAIAYFMPGSRYGYAWYVAGFLPPLMWATTYGDVANTFHYSTFRFLETSAGIVVYTLVSVFLWPRNAGRALDRAGDDLWAGLHELFGMYRRQLETGELPDEAAGLRSKLAGSNSKFLATLDAAFADTPAVASHRMEWKSLRRNLPALGEALILWRECIEDSRHLDLARLLPGLDPSLDTLEGRLARVGELWRARAGADEVQEDADGDAALLRPLELEVDRPATMRLAPFDRAAILAFARELRHCDETSRELLGSLRELAGLDSRPGPARLPVKDSYRLPRLDLERLAKAAFPAVCFVCAFVFWIYTDPPSGASVVSMAATGALLSVLNQVRIATMIPAMFLSVWLVVAPIYFLVMPRLDGGLGLLGVIFAYAFVASMIGARWPLRKTAMLMMFVMITGIQNEQVYSFIGLVDGAMMVLLGFGIVAVLQNLLNPARPERVLRREVGRYFRGCARIIGGLAGDRRGSGSGSGDGSGDRDGTRAYESMVRPVPRRLQPVVKQIDYALFSGNDEERVQRLVGALQAMANRIRALERARARVAHHSVEWPAPLVAIGAELRDRMHGLFESWSRFDVAESVDEDGTLRDLGRNLEEELDSGENLGRVDHLDDRALGDLYAFLGCARGLVRESVEVQHAASRICWGELAEARF